MANISVANASQLKAALSSAKSGDTISLSGGNYGDFSLSGLKFASDVTIKSADPGNVAAFHSLSVTGSSGINFVGVNIDMTPTMTTYAYSSAFRISGSSDISFSGGKIAGGAAVNGVSPDAPVGASDSSGNVLGHYTGRGVTIEKSSSVTIENTEISQLMKGIVLSHVDGLKLVGNEIHHTRTGMISGGDVSNALIDGNNIYSSNPHNFSGAGDHADFIHLWTSASGQDGPSENIVITNNLIKQGDGQAILGIYLDDNGLGVGFKNAVISDNAILNGNFQGLRLENVFDSIVQNNTLLQTSGEAKTAPGILLRSGSRDNEISGNITATIDVNGDVSNNIGQNTIVQTKSPAAAGYYTTELAKLFELQADATGIYAAVLKKLGLLGGNLPDGGEPVALPPEEDGAIAVPPVMGPPPPSTPIGKGPVDQILSGGAGVDKLTGGYGSDTINGQDGDDVISGGGGADLMVGGKGDDLFYVDHTGDVVVEAAGGGIDTVASSIDYSLGANVENLRLSKEATIGTGNEVANRITASEGDSKLYGMAGDDTLLGRNGADQLFGGDGHDYLHGDDGNDSVSGGAGNDSIFGGTGSDTLSGGAGADRFLFATKDLAADVVDVIVDFSRAQGDKIGLSSIDANIATAKNEAFLFIGQSEFSHKAGQLRVEVDNAGSIVTGDINGDGAADFTIYVTGVTNLAATDFVL
jgi:Ca2+-binding RTX toxin-like protein